MRYGVFSDVHANLEAMTAVLDALRREDIDEYIFLGDIVGYGADPAACLHRLRDLMSEKKCYCLAGNHDSAVCGLTDPAGFNAFAREAVRWTRKQLPARDIEWLKARPLTAGRADWAAVHGSLWEPQRWHYITGLTDARSHLERQQARVSFVGHSHHAWIISCREKAQWAGKTEESLEPGARYVVNDGSVGQPRDGDPRASYAVYDDGARRVELKRVDYDIELAQRKIREAGLPSFLAGRLTSGI